MMSIFPIFIAQSKYNMSSRRTFIKNTSLAGAGLCAIPSFATNIISPADKLNVALIGAGLRGTNHLQNLLLRKDVNITAICDVDPARITVAKELISNAGAKAAQVFGKNDYDYKNLLELKEVDAVIIATPWLWHTRMAVDAMKAGKYTGVEVSASNTLEECWDLVNTHEATGSHLMILENVNYRRDVLAVLNMVKQNVFGELVHFRCGYQHDLRFVKLNDGKTAYGKGVEFGEKGISESSLENRSIHCSNEMPMYIPLMGLGQVATMCNDIIRGNRFDVLSHQMLQQKLLEYITISLKL